MLADPSARTTADPQPDTGDPGSSPRRAFFERKRVERERREHISVIVSAAAREIHRGLTARSADSLLLSAQPQAMSDRQGEMTLNGAYLVDRERSEQFPTEARKAAERHRSLGLSVVLSGPFAPYSFVSDRAPQS